MPPVVSCFTNSYLRFGAKAAIEHLRATGLENLELAIRTEGKPSFFKDEPIVTDRSSLAELKDVQQQIDRAGLTVTSCNVTSANPLAPENVTVIKQKLDRAAHFGVDRVVGAAGELEDESQRETLYAHLREIGDHAAKLGIIHCFETHPGICVNHREMLRTIEELDHPQLRLNFDTGNIHYYNRHIDGEVALAKVCHYVEHVHLKDSSGEFEDWDFAELGSGGAVNFVRVRELMSNCGFQGPYSLELEGIGDEDPQPVEVYQQRIANSVKRLHEWGYFS